MGENLQSLIFVLAGLSIISLILQLGLASYLLLSSRSSQKALTDSVRELYGIMKKIEGLTATRREQLLCEFDGIMQTLSLRLPTVIASQAGDNIFEAESKLMKRLAEIDPGIKDEKSKERMDEIIKSLESLQENVIAITAETVRKVLLDARKDLPLDSDSGAS